MDFIAVRIYVVSTLRMSKFRARFQEYLPRGRRGLHLLVYLLLSENIISHFISRDIWHAYMVHSLSVLILVLNKISIYSST